MDLQQVHRLHPKDQEVQKPHREARFSHVTVVWCTTSDLSLPHLSMGQP